MPEIPRVRPLAEGRGDGIQKKTQHFNADAYRVGTKSAYKAKVQSATHRLRCSKLPSPEGAAHDFGQPHYLIGNMADSDDGSWPILSLATISALVLCVSSVLLYVRYSQKSSTEKQRSVEETDTRPVVRILYGTQTGTAEKFSKQLATALCETYGQYHNFVIEDVENFDHENIDAVDALFFLMATYGDGEPTDNALAFVEWLTAKSEAVMNGDSEEIFKVQASLDHVTARAHGCSSECIL
jgi:Flavodoxin